MCDWKYLEPIEVNLEALMAQYAGEPATSAYLKEIAPFQPLPAEEQEALAKLALEGDVAVRERLVETNLGLVAVIAATYEGRGLLILDLVSAGNMGLLRAVETFDPGQGQPFVQYVQGWIHRAISEELANMNITPRIPTELLKRINAVHRCMKMLKEELGREPDVEEIAQAMDLTEKQVRAAIHLEEQPLSLDVPISLEEQPLSLDVPISLEDDTPLGDQIPSPLPMPPEVAQKVEELLERMTPREAEVIRMRFGMDDGHTHTLDEVAAAFGITRERVRQIENKAIRRRGYRRSDRLKRIAEFYNR